MLKNILSALLKHEIPGKTVVQFLWQQWEKGVVIELFHNLITMTPLIEYVD